MPSLWSSIALGRERIARGSNEWLRRAREHSADLLGRAERSAAELRDRLADRRESRPEGARRTLEERLLGGMESALGRVARELRGHVHCLKSESRNTIDFSELPSGRESNRAAASANESLPEGEIVEIVARVGSDEVSAKSAELVSAQSAELVSAQSAELVSAQSAELVSAQSAELVSDERSEVLPTARDAVAVGAPQVDAIVATAEPVAAANAAPESAGSESSGSESAGSESAPEASTSAFEDSQKPKDLRPAARRSKPPGEATPPSNGTPSVRRTKTAPRATAARATRASGKSSATPERAPKPSARADGSELDGAKSNGSESDHAKPPTKINGTNPNEPVRGSTRWVNPPESETESASQPAAAHDLAKLSELPARDLIAVLPELSPEQIEALLAQERTTKKRKTVIRALASRLPS